VRDNGIGIPEKHGGTIQPASGGLGQGSQFVVTLPVVVVETDAAAPDSGQPQPKDRIDAPRQVLVVGYEAIRLIRQQPGGADALAIALTGWNQDDTVRRVSEAGFDHHLVKPVAYEKLRDLLLRPRTRGHSSRDDYSRSSTMCGGSQVKSL
jgi:CheY-like chemotaxis protein